MHSRLIAVVLIAPIVYASSRALRGSPPSGVCTPATNSSGWLFATPQDSGESCKSSAGGTNDLGSTPEMCSNDVTSVRIGLAQGKAECLVAVAPQCKIPMHEFVSLDYNFAMDGCMGVWAAPLWLTPMKWQNGVGSGEIDSLEFCPRDKAALNFAGGGHEVKRAISLDSSNGHITVRKDAAGVVTTTACTQAEASSNSGQCQAPTYKDCAECLQGDNTYGCYCNTDTTPANIYGSGGCTHGGNCMWTLVSDIWNGVSGDPSFDGCMSAVPSLGLERAKPNLNSRCAFSVEKITIRGGGPNDSITFGEGSPQACSAFTTQH